MRCLRLTSPLALSVALSTVALRSVEASPSISVHVEAAAARPIGDAKSEQFGWGGTALVSPELVLHRVVGLELGVGILGLSDGTGPDPKGVAPTKGAFAAFSTVGPRVRPFATLARGRRALGPEGLWIAGGFGAGLTGGALRPAVQAAVGFDAFSPVVAAGPYVGYFQMVEPSSSVRPEDARVAVFGLHGAFAPPARPVEGDPDRDKDGIVNEKDACPDVAEDKDGFEDQDGCPDLDDDKDGIPDTEDRCRLEPEDKDGFQDDDGCPDLDNDKDGILDAKDACPNEKEDMDGFEDEDGCPDLDNDRDGFPDAVDHCPNEPETVNGFNDEDGCPDTANLHVNGDRIVLDDRIHFDSDSAKVKMKSWLLVQHLADFMNEHPEYQLVHVEGHADATGSPQYNFALSQARAQSVRDLLVRFGVDSARLSVEAFGQSKPRELGDTESARAENRRVEFVILTRAPLDASAASKASAP